MKGWMWGLGLFMAVVLSGCIEQEVKIRLNADGSGRVEVVRNLSEMESGALLLGDAEALAFSAMTAERTFRDSESGPRRKVEHSVYTFDNLGAALPELEHEVPMMPRFSLRGDQLVVFLCHEMNPYHGFSSEDQTTSFYRLEMEFPVAPEADGGTVEGNRFLWAADHEQLLALKESEIGTRAFECRLPAAAVRLDLTPRVVEYKDQRKRFGSTEKEPDLLASLDVTIPVLDSNSAPREGENGTLEVYLPVGEAGLPLCYEGLKVRELVIDGQGLAAKLESQPSGLFFGADQYGRAVPGLPVKLKFGWNSNVLKSIDRIEVGIQAAAPTRLSRHTLAVESAAATNAVLRFAGHPNTRLGVLKVHHARMQTASLTMATNLDPSELEMVFLDTDYGLRYSAKGLRWKAGSRLWGAEKEQAAKWFAEGEPFSVLEVDYPHIPTTSFGLEFSLVEEKELTELVLKQEGIDVH